MLRALCLLCVQVWDEADQPQVFRVEPYFPHREQAAEEVGARDQPTLQVRGGVGGWRG